MKYIRENKQMLGVAIIMQIPLIAVLIVLIINEINSNLESEAWLLMILPASFEVCTLFLLNCGFSKIWYDPSTQELCRKGWLWGRNYRIPLSEIKEIVLVSMNRSGGTHYIVVKKGRNLQLVPYANPKIFRLAYTRESQQFVESFWHNFIPTIETTEVKNYKN